MATINIDKREVIALKRNGRVNSSVSSGSYSSSFSTNGISYLFSNGLLNTDNTVTFSGTYDGNKKDPSGNYIPSVVGFNIAGRTKIKGNEADFISDAPIENSLALEVIGNTKITGDLNVIGNITASKDVIAYIGSGVTSTVLDALSVSAPLAKTGTNINLKVNAAQLEVNASNELQIKSNVLAPASHTHIISDVTGLQTALDNKLATSLKGAVNGLAELDSTGKVLSSQLPSYVDDVLEVASSLFFPETGDSGKIYITANDNKTFRWSGSAYTEISASLALGVTSSTAYRGDLGNIAYTHSQTTHDKNLVGLSNVDNTSDANKPVSTATQTALNLKAPLASPSFTGNVGINVASPTEPLQIAYESNALDSVNPLVVGSYTTGANKVGIYTKIFSSSPFGGGYVFKTYKRNVGAYDAVTIDDTGNVGINGNLTVGSNINYAGTLSLTKTVDGYNIVNLRGTTNYPSRFVLYGVGDTTIQASISQAGYGDTYFKSPVFIGGYTADPTSGNKLAVSGNSYYKGVLTVDAYDSSNTIAFGSAAGIIIKSNKTAAFGNDNSLLFRTETTDMGGISSVYNSYTTSIAGANLDFYTRTSATTVDRILRLASDKNAVFAGGATFNGFLTATGLTVEAGTYDWNITQSSGNLKFDHYGTSGITFATDSTITANELTLYATDADILKTTDTGQVRIAGGSAASSAKGATLQCFGNGYATAAYKGQVRLIAGSGDGTANFGSIYFSTVDSASANTERFRITGGVTIATASFSDCNVTVGGNITASGEVTAYSDKRLKEDIKPLTVRGELNPVTYTKDGKASIGFIAQEVKEVYPELVVGDEDKEMLSLNYQQLTAVLYAEIKELKERIKKLEGENK